MRGRGLSGGILFGRGEFWGGDFFKSKVGL